MVCKSESKECPTCGRDDFKTAKGMKTHHKMKHGVSIAGKEYICAECDEPFIGFDTSKGPRKFCSTKCYGKSKQKSPEDLEDFYHSNKWQSVKEIARARDSYMCQDCGSQESALHVHHKIPISEGGDRFDMSNLVTVCQSCHVERHKN